MRRFLGLTFLLAACTGYQAAVEVPDVGVVAGGSQPCLTISDSSLRLGQRLTAAPIPESSTRSTPISVIEVTEIHPGACAGLWGAYGDSDYFVRIVDGATPGQKEPYVEIPTRTGRLVAGNGLLHLVTRDSVDTGVFRACTSLEGLHLTLWDGSPLVSRRMWHSYFLLAYDVEPTCTDEDY